MAKKSPADVVKKCPADPGAAAAAAMEGATSFGDSGLPFGESAGSTMLAHGTRPSRDISLLATSLTWMVRPRLFVGGVGGGAPLRREKE